MKQGNTLVPGVPDNPTFIEWALFRNSAGSFI